MPTFISSVTLDRFLEPGDTKDMPTVDKKFHLSEASFSFPPPSTINHKRQDSPLLKNLFQAHRQDGGGAEVVQNGRNSNGKDVFVAGGSVSVSSPRDEVVKTYERYNGFHNGTGDSSSSNLAPVTTDVDVSEDFFDPRDSMSVTSSVETDDNVGIERCFKMSTPLSEFYDAYEELSEGGSQNSYSQNSFRDVEAELRERRLSWLMEIEGRKQAEEALDHMKRQWERLAQKLSQEGLTLPPASDIAVEDEKLEIDPAEELCEQIRLARTISTSVGRGAAKAEAEIEFESKLETKNFEISRLLQRLKYYETVNHEMSLRNQEAAGMARRLTQRRKRRQRWIWSAVGVSVVLGSVALAWSHLHTTSGSSPPDSCHSLEGDSGPKEVPN